MAKRNIINKVFAAGPLFLLYYLSISEIDANLEKLFDVFSLNLQIIIIILDNKTSKFNGSRAYIFSRSYQ